MLDRMRKLTSMGLLSCGLSLLGCQGGQQASNDPHPPEPAAVPGERITEFRVNADEAAAVSATARQAGIKVQARHIPRPEEIQQAPKVIPAEELDDADVGHLDVVVSTPSKVGGAK